MFLGDQLEKVVESIVNEGSAVDANHKVGAKSKMLLGVNSLPALPRDASDRNRTSAFAFTGNKFEFRAVGSSQTCARPMLVLNTIVADSINYVTDLLEKEVGKGETRQQAIQTIVTKVLKEFKGAIFNGNNYSDEWKQEAARRKLWNLPSSPEAFREWGSDKNKKLFSKLGVLTEEELISHQHVLYENYLKGLNVEAQCLVNMAQTYILPAAFEYKSKMFNWASQDKSGAQQNYFTRINNLTNELLSAIEDTKKTMDGVDKFHEEQLHEKATYFYKELVFGQMKRLRHVCDELENVVDNKIWPLPKYSEMLFLK